MDGYCFTMHYLGFKKRYAIVKAATKWYWQVSIPIPLVVYLLRDDRNHCRNTYTDGNRESLYATATATVFKNLKCCQIVVVPYHFLVVEFEKLLLSAIC